MIWPTARLGEVAEIERIGVDPSKLASETRYLGLEHIERGGRIIGSQAVGDAAVTSTKFEFDQRHVLYGKLRPNLAKVARPSFAGVCSTDILPILPGSKLDRGYITHFLTQPSMTEHAARLATGANLPRLSPSALATFELPLPPLQEQRRIAATLDQADALRAKRLQALARLDDLTQSIFTNRFGDAASITNRWKTVSLGGLLSFLTSGSRGWAQFYVPSGAQFLRIQNVRQGKVDLDDVISVRPPDSAEARRTRVASRDVLMSITADLGRTGIVPPEIGEAYINQHLSILRVDGINPVYLSSFLASPAGQTQILRRNRQGVKAGLNFEDIRSLQIPLPPDVEQDNFEKTVNTVSGPERQYATSVLTLEKLITALQSRAFAGQL